MLQVSILIAAKKLNKMTQLINIENDWQST